MGEEHCAVGPKNKRQKLDDAVAAKNTTAPPPPKKKVTAKKKGPKKGVRVVPAPEPKKIKRWQVRVPLIDWCALRDDPNPNYYMCFEWQIGDSVNARHSKGGSYGAFITCVHTDMTYDVYFPEEPSIPGTKIHHRHLKLPIQTPRQKNFSNWEKYHGKVFYDAGTKKGEDPEDPNYSLAPGEWVVDSVTADNNFVCLRIGQEYNPEDNTQFDIGYVMRRIRKYEEE